MGNFTPLVTRKILKSAKNRLEREKMNIPPDIKEVKRLEGIVKKLERILERGDVYSDSFGHEYKVVSLRSINE